LPSRKPALRSAWFAERIAPHMNCGRKKKDRTRSRVTEINAIFSL
jgi:hypothetical protein